MPKASSVRSPRHDNLQLSAACVPIDTSMFIPLPCRYAVNARKLLSLSPDEQPSSKNALYLRRHLFTLELCIVSACRLPRILHCPSTCALGQQYPVSLQCIALEITTGISFDGFPV